MWVNFRKCKEKKFSVGKAKSDLFCEPNKHCFPGLIENFNFQFYLSHLWAAFQSFSRCVHICMNCTLEYPKEVRKWKHPPTVTIFIWCMATSSTIIFCKSWHLEKRHFHWSSKKHFGTLKSVFAIAKFQNSFRSQQKISENTFEISLSREPKSIKLFSGPFS